MPNDKITFNLVEGIVPKGNINITNTNEVNVYNYATAKVVDANLQEENILHGKTILGIPGTAPTSEEMYGEILTETYGGNV